MIRLDFSSILIKTGSLFSLIQYPLFQPLTGLQLMGALIEMNGTKLWNEYVKLNESDIAITLLEFLKLTSWP